MKTSVQLAIIFPILVIVVLLIVVFYGGDITRLELSPDNFLLQREGSDETIPISPTAIIHPNSGNFKTGESIPFSAGESRDQDGKIVRYEWDFGEGGTNEGLSTTHSYSDAGVYKVTLTVVDDDEEYDSTNAVIVIESNLPSNIPDTKKSPIAKIAGQNTVIVNQRITLSADESLDSDGTIIKYDWDLGDGSKNNGKTINHIYESPGKYGVLLIVTDNDKLTTVTSKTITVNYPPIPETLPNPILTFDGSEETESRGNQLILYKLSVSNRNVYSDELFVKSPDLPPCGLNENAARTWVDIYDAQTEKRIYGYCGIESSSRLDRIWFNVSVDAVPPQEVYVEFTDREENKKYISNSVMLK